MTSPAGAVNESKAGTFRGYPIAKGKTLPQSPAFLPLVGPFKNNSKHVETVQKEANRHFEVVQKEANRHTETIAKESTMYRTQNAADIKKQELRNDSVRMEREMEIEKLKALAEIEKSKKPKSITERVRDFIRTPWF